MPFEYKPPPSLIIIPSATAATIQLPAVAADKALPSIVIPAYKGELLAAYLTFEGDSYGAAAGTVDGDQYIQIDNSDGSGYHNAILVPNGSIYVSAAAQMTNSAIVQGAIDIKAYCAAGSTLTIKWTNAKGTAAINIWTLKLRLELVFV